MLLRSDILENSPVSKRAQQFEKAPRDLYPTPREGVLPLVPYLPAGCTFVEPCAAAGQLVDHLEAHGMRCVFASDIAPGRDDVHALSAFSLRYILADFFITNPPWTWEVLELMAFHLSNSKPTWLLLPSDMLCNVRSARLVDRCALVVPVGRLKWIEGSEHSGVDNCAWMRFEGQHKGGPKFMPRLPKIGLTVKG